MLQPKLFETAPAELVPNDWNTNFVSPENLDKLRESIRRNGMFKPILVRELDGRYEIIGGQHRWEIAVEMGLEKIPVANFGAISDHQAKEVSVLDNLRYGVDDTLQFADLLKSLGDMSELQQFIPFADEDFSAIFSSSEIALDDLEIDEDFENSSETPEPPAAKAPKTHTIMRFKVPLADAERITALIAKTRNAQGFTSADDLTNAGDALVHLLINQFVTEEKPLDDDIDAVLDSLDADE